LYVKRKFHFEISEFQLTFPALTGILSLAYFIHNAVISIVSNQQNPQNNVSINFFTQYARSFFFENINKALSVMILTSSSIDRLQQYCKGKGNVIANLASLDLFFFAFDPLRC